MKRLWTADPLLPSFLPSLLFGNLEPLLELLAWQSLVSLIRLAWDNEFPRLPFVLVPKSGPPLCDLLLMLTGNKKEKKAEQKLWSLPSSNIMESVSLGFGRKRSWWQRDTVMPAYPWLLFHLMLPLSTDRGHGEPTIQPVTRQPWETQILFKNKTNKHQSLNALTPKVTCVTHVSCETPEKHKTSERPFDLAPSWEHFNQLTMKSLHFAYAGLYIKWLWSGWHFTASKIKDGNKCQVKLGWFWGFCSAFSSPTPFLETLLLQGQNGQISGIDRNSHTKAITHRTHLLTHTHTHILVSIEGVLQLERQGRN